MLPLRISYFSTFTVAFFLIATLTQEVQGQDRIYLKDGKKIVGMIVEEIPPISLVRVQLPDSSFRVLDMKDIFQIFRGAVQEGYWDQVTLKEGAVVQGFITLYQAGVTVGMEVPGNKKVQATFDYLEIDKIERVPIERRDIQRRNKQLVKARTREESEPPHMRYLGEYGVAGWGEFSEKRLNLVTTQILLFDFSSRFSLGMGMGLDFNLNLGQQSLLAGNSFFGASRYYFPGEGTRPYFLMDAGYDFIRDGFFMNPGVGIRVAAGKTRLNFSLALRLQQTDILGNAQNSLSTPDPPKMLEILQLKVVFE